MDSSREKAKKNLFGEGGESKWVRFRDSFEWDGVSLDDYKKSSEDWHEVSRRVLLGEVEESLDFHLRYFEIGVGGYTTHETHQHTHVVIVFRGSGEVRIGSRVRRVRMGDVLYVAPEEAHQFRNPDGKEPFGFFCIVEARRDRPETVPESGELFDQ